MIHPSKIRDRLRSNPPSFPIEAAARQRLYELLLSCCIINIIIPMLIYYYYYRCIFFILFVCSFIFFLLFILRLKRNIHFFSLLFLFHCSFSFVVFNYLCVLFFNNKQHCSYNWLLLIAPPVFRFLLRWLSAARQEPRG